MDRDVLATTSLLRELDEQLAAADDAVTSRPARPDEVRTRLARARELVALLRTRTDDDPAASEGSDVLALVRQLELPAQRMSARRARAFAGETCEQWDLPGAVRTAVVDVASELVANAAEHGSGTVVLALERGAGNLLVRVWDDGPGLPRVLPYRPGLSEKGLGLRLVRQLSTHWGAATDEAGKWVWARIAMPDAPTP